MTEGGDTQTLEVTRPSSNDMRHYYEKYLPFEEIYKWLNHGDEASADFGNREFAFEHGSGAYQRYLSFKDGGELKRKVVRAVPTRFEVGAVYAVEPCETRKSGGKLGKPIEKELVLDIDVTDYDDVRRCCSGTAICSKCWKFVSIAVECVDRTLVEDFGVADRVWVFSGRRGVHCWVSDERMRQLSESGRRAVVEYMKGVTTTTTTSSNSTTPPPLHPYLERTLDIAKRHFVDVVLREQDVWGSRDGARALAATVPDATLRAELLRLWDAQGEARGDTQDSTQDSTQGSTLSLQRWLDVSAVYARLSSSPSSAHVTSPSFSLAAWKRERVLATLAPRLDAEVTRQPGHLLKAPFCVHPATGRVCVPFAPPSGDGDTTTTTTPFNPFTDAPTVHQLLSESENGDLGESGDLDGDDDVDGARTGALGPSLRLFARHVQRVVSRGRERGRESEKESENEKENENESKRARLEW